MIKGVDRLHLFLERRPIRTFGVGRELADSMQREQASQGRTQSCLIAVGVKVCKLACMHACKRRCSLLTLDRLTMFSSLCMRVCLHTCIFVCVDALSGILNHEELT